MFETLFKLEALLLEAAEIANPAVLSTTDLQNLNAMALRVKNRADKAVAAGAVRPSDEPVPFAIV